VKPDTVVLPLVTTEPVEGVQRLQFAIGMKKKGYGSSCLIQRSKLQIANSIHFHIAFRLLVPLDEAHENVHMRAQIRDVNREMLMLPFLVNKPIE
jgi:hypothetical protein